MQCGLWSSEGLVGQYKYKLRDLFTLNWKFCPNLLLHVALSLYYLLSSWNIIYHMASKDWQLVIFGVWQPLFTNFIEKCSCFVFHRRKKVRFRMAWGWVNDDRRVIFEWTIPKVVSAKLRSCLWNFCKKNWANSVHYSLSIA